MVRICGMIAMLFAAAGPLEGGPRPQDDGLIPLLRQAEPGPNGLVAAPDGTLYFTDPSQQVVWRLSAGGQPVPFVTGVSGQSLLVDEGGHVYGTHIAGRRNVLVWRADPQGRLVRIGRGRNAAEAQRIMVDAWSGDRPAPPAAWAPDGMTRLAGGELVVTSGPAVRMVALDGRVTTLADGGRLLEPRTGLLGRFLGDPPSHLTGVAGRAGGDVYVANTAGRTVVRITPGGAVEKAYESDEGWRPSGVAAVAGAIFVLETGAGVRLRTLERDGSSRVIAAVSPTRSAAAGEPWPWLPI